MNADIQQYVNRHRDEMLAHLIEFVEIPSVSTTDSDMEPAVRFLTRQLEQAEFAVKIIETPGNPVILADIGPDDGDYELLIYGHYDVFPAETSDGWSSPPFEARLDGDRLYARGAGDNKGQLLAHIEAVRTLNALGFRLPGKVKLIIEGEEEIGSRHLPGVVKDYAEGLRSDLCFYSDGPMMAGNQPIIVFGVRGAVVIELVARGARRVLHSGNFGGAAPAPALELCRLLASLVAPDGTVTAPGFDRGVPPVSDAERDAIAALPDARPGMEAEMGVAPESTRWKQNLYERLLLRPNFNVCGIATGWAGEGNRPIIPNEARAKVDIRLVGDQDPDEVVTALRAFAAQTGHSNIEITPIIAQPASKTPLTDPNVSQVKGALYAGFGREPLLVPGLGGTTPEYVFTKTLGMPTFCAPYAPHDESNHAPDESTKISLFLGGIRSTAELLLSLRRVAPQADTKDPVLTVNR